MNRPFLPARHCRYAFTTRRVLDPLPSYHGLPWRCLAERENKAPTTCPLSLPKPYASFLPDCDMARPNHRSAASRPGRSPRPSEEPAQPEDRSWTMDEVGREVALAPGYHLLIETAYRLSCWPTSKEVRTCLGIGLWRPSRGDRCSRVESSGAD